MMTPKQLEKVIGTTAKQQSKLREEGSFPIPHINMGRNILYSVYAVADVLLTGKTEDKAKQEKETEQIVVSQAVSLLPSKKKITRQNAPQDLSQLILVKSFVSSLTSQRDNIDFLIDHFTKLAKFKGMHDNFQTQLPLKPVGKKNDGKV